MCNLIPLEDTESSRVERFREPTTYNTPRTTEIELVVPLLLMKMKSSGRVL